MLTHVEQALQEVEQSNDKFLSTELQLKNTELEVKKLQNQNEAFQKKISELKAELSRAKTNAIAEAAISGVPTVASAATTADNSSSAASGRDHAFTSSGRRVSFEVDMDDKKPQGNEAFNAKVAEKIGVLQRLLREVTEQNNAAAQGDGQHSLDKARAMKNRKQDEVDALQNSIVLLTNKVKS